MFADNLPESIIKQLSIRVKKINGINLGQGIPSFPTAPHIIVAAKDALNDPVIGVYPNFLGTIELRQALVGKLKQESQIELNAEKNILITVGAMEATAAAILSIVENNDRVGVITPDYCNHFPQIQLARGEIVEIPLDEKNNWDIDLDKIKIELAKGLRLLIVTNPNNPTGSVVSKQSLDQLIILCKEYDTWLLFDETYSFLSYDEKFTSLLNYWNQYDKLLIVRSFSKEYAMTGWRVGYIVGQEPAIKIFAKVHDALTGCAPKISQMAALAAVTGSQTIVGEYQKVLSGRRDLVCKLLDEFKDVLAYIRPRGAYYIFPRFNLNTSAQNLCEEILTETGVAVVPGIAFGNSGENHLRISFSVDDDKLKAGVAKIGQFLRQKQAK